MPISQILWMLLTVVTTLFGCAASKTPEPVGGETHFLQGCEGEGSCGLGLDCVCGVCTKPCVTDNSCKDQSSLATCEAAGTPSGACDNPLASPVCDVKCTLDSECKPLGATYTCEAGSCRKLQGGNCVANGIVYPACMDAGIDSGIDSGTNGIDAAVSYFEDSGLIAAAQQACGPLDSDAGDGLSVDPSNPISCPELDAVLSLPGATVVAFPLTPVVVIALGPDDIFWSELYSLHRVAKIGGDAFAFPAGISDAFALTVDGCRLHAGSGGFVSSSALDTGNYRAIASFPAATEIGNIVVDDTSLYAWVQRDLQRIPKAGGTIFTMAHNTISGGTYSDRTDLAADALNLYWIDRKSTQPPAVEDILTMPKDGSAPPRVAASGIAGPVSVHLNAGHLYVLAGGTRDPLGNYNGDGRIQRIRIADGDVTTLATFTERNSVPQDIEVDDRDVYWVTASWVPRFNLMRVPADGSGAPVTLESQLDGYAGNLAADATHLYWSGSCTVDGIGHSFIVRIPKP